SGTDVAQLLEDEYPVPKGPFRVRLTLRKVKGGTEVIGRVNGVRFASKLLPGLEARTAKLALGCRNLDCTFEGLEVQGREMPKPARRPRASGAAE
ncbi:MAG: serine/threonine protein kinase, partial [Myxococcaceae bacterium]|nr:serine/threonine protein kinase [Myxococcaceae bacterium]